MHTKEHNVIHATLFFTQRLQKLTKDMCTKTFEIKAHEMELPPQMDCT